LPHGGNESESAGGEGGSVRRLPNGCGAVWRGWVAIPHAQARAPPGLLAPLYSHQLSASSLRHLWPPGPTAKG